MRLKHGTTRLRAGLGAEITIPDWEDPTPEQWVDWFLGQSREAQEQIADYFLGVDAKWGIVLSLAELPDKGEGR